MLQVPMALSPFLLHGARPALLMVLALASCRRGPTISTHVHDHPAEPSPLAAQAVTGVSDARLRAVLANHWEAMLRRDPVSATTLGDHRYDHLLPARDAASLAAQRRERDALLEAARQVPAAELSPADRVTQALLVEELAAQQAGDVCAQEQWAIGAGGSSVLSALSYVVEAHGVQSPDDATRLLSRLGQAKKLIADTITNLRAGLTSGRVASAETLRRAVAQLDAALATPPESWQLATPKWTTAPTPDPWPAGRRAALSAELRALVAGELVPAFTELRAFLATEALPRGRTGGKEGLTGLPDGAACYRSQILRHLGLAKTPEELHAIGLAEIARTDRELAALGARALGTASLATTLERLRTDRSLGFSSGPELLAAATRALARAKEAMPRAFRTLPKADCVVREIPVHEAPYTTTAYYREPHLDGSKPGEYFVNTYEPHTRPRYELAALTWHESIPGHHLQIAIARELGELPAFRRLDGSTAFIEGWALYSERLAEELGLYETDLDRLGQKSYDAWRASRLVVDTGLHHLGWTRAQAEDFMRAHTALSFANISNEVDRYISWPGQALAYKIGQLEISRLRAKAEATLGPAFDLRAFHEVVLGAGAVSLPVLAARVEEWLNATKRS